MRRRLLAVLLALMGAATLLLAVPLADAYARGRTEHLLLQRRADAVRFADLAERGLTEADQSELSTEIHRYALLYDAGVLITDANGRPVLRAGPRSRWAGPDLAEATDRALAGRSTERLPTVHPWGPGVAVLAEPVGRDERVSGVAVLAVPTDAARRDVGSRWSLIAAGALLAFTAAALAAVGITRWLLRPVRDLDRAVGGLAAGSLHTRADLDAGPPELRRLRLHFNAMAEGMSEAIRRQRDFVADASHQLRNPLATLVLQLENVEPHLAPAGHDEHARALEETERLAELLDGLLALARVESGTAERTPQDASAAARERAAAWAPVYREAGLELAVEVADGLRVRALPGAVGRVLDALLDNAAKFVPPGGRVRVAADLAPDGRVAVRVTDDGPGVPAGQHPALVRRFARGADHQNLPGSGLGLAIADELARASGGTLTTAGVTPHGLAVELRLPALGASS
ncbi:ATP-binding protein [Streptomyces sp. NPDC057702]|uniref:sensor histidine kinase n=1 Tax=unclassified Streptomyces TaxID=2593676 RepID=UPI0036B667FC